jgi:branched-chain amino acid aminotransferase
MIWLNGNIVAAEGALSANDRGLLLGEAVFETILIKQGAAQFWPEHMQRLWQACAYADLATPYSPEVLQQAAASLMAQSPPAPRHVLRITVTGGDGGRGLVPQTDSPPNWLMQINPLAPMPSLWHLIDSEIICDTNRPPYKTTSYLENIRARRAALKAGGDDAILFNQNGDLVGAPAGNLFVGLNNRLLTPRLRDGALPGIMRQQIMQLKSVELDGQQWHIDEAALSRQMVSEAQFIVMSNSVMEVLACAYAPNARRGSSKQQAQKMAACLIDKLPF